MVGGARTPGQPGSVDETKRQQPPPVRMDGNPRYRASTNPLSANPMIAYLKPASSLVLQIWASRDDLWFLVLLDRCKIELHIAAKAFEFFVNVALEEIDDKTGV